MVPMIEKPAGKERRPRGRPKLAAGEAKRAPLVIRTSKEVRTALEEAARLSGRSLTAEIEYRLAQSLAEDRGKSEFEARVDKAMAELRKTFLVLVGYHGAERADHPPTILTNALGEGPLVITRSGKVVTFDFSPELREL